MEPSPLERIITTPGLQHIALHIFGNTQAKDLFKCKKVNKNWKDSVEKMWVYYLKTLPAFKKRQAKLTWRRAINRTITKIRKAKGGVAVLPSISFAAAIGKGSLNLCRGNCRCRWHV